MGRIIVILLRVGEVKGNITRERERERERERPHFYRSPAFVTTYL